VTDRTLCIRVIASPQRAHSWHPRVGPLSVVAGGSDRDVLVRGRPAAESNSIGPPTASCLGVGPVPAVPILVVLAGGLPQGLLQHASWTARATFMARASSLTEGTRLQLGPRSVGGLVHPLAAIPLSERHDCLRKSNAEPPENVGLWYTTPEHKPFREVRQC
jgi:hypothetical protein